jgi:molybdopterin synthase sulfur carrier subunit
MRDQSPVTVRLVYLARLREAFGSEGESYAVGPQRPATVEGLIDDLRARGGAFATELASGRAFRVAVNHAMALPAQGLHDGDEVAIFPPVTGG